MAKARHPDEIVLDNLVEYFYADLKMLWDWWWVEGRPAFGQSLSDDEKWRRFSDPAMRAEVEAMIQYAIANKVMPPTAVLGYYDQMAKIAARYGPSGPAGALAPVGPGNQGVTGGE